MPRILLLLLSSVTSDHLGSWLGQKRWGNVMLAFQELLHNSSELTLISGDLKCYYDLPFRVGPYRGPVIMKFWPRSPSQQAQWAPTPNLCLSPLFHNLKLIDISETGRFPHWFLIMCWLFLLKRSHGSHQN